MSKSLYIFNIYKTAEVEEDKQETVTNEQGEQITRTYKEKIKKQIPVEINILLPNRKQMQEADMEFSIEMSKCIRNGILTKAMLLNKYSDTGGLISDTDAKTMVSAASEIGDLQSRLTILNLKPESERDDDYRQKIEKVTSEILQRRKTLIEKETSYMTLFNHTADIKAQNRAILWYILNLTQFKDNSKKNAEFEWLFPGKTFDVKEAAMFEYEENKNEIYEKCYSKLASLISYWFFTSNTEKEEFDRIIGEIDGTIPTE